MNLLKSIPKFLFVLFIFGLVSCTDKKRTDEITIIGEDSANIHALEKLGKDYKQKHHVKINFSANKFNDVQMKANQDLVNQTGLYDILLQYNFSLSNYVKNKYVYNLKDLRSMIDTSKLSFEADIFESAWKETAVYYDPEVPANKGEMKIGYPFAANTMLLVYNKQMFEDAGNKARYKARYQEELSPPLTWTQFRRIAEFFTDRKKKTYGVCLQGSADGFLYYEFCHILFGMGGKVFNKKYGWQDSSTLPLEIDSEEGIQVADFYKSLKPFNAGNFTSVDAAQQVLELKKGNVAMGIVWSDYLYGLCYGNKDTVDSRFGYAPSPGDVSPLAGGCFYVNRKSENPKVAMEYIVSMMQKPAQIELAKSGASSVLRSVYDDPQVKKIPYSDALKRSLDRGVYMFEAGIESTIISDVLTAYVQRLYNGDLNAAAAMKGAKAEIDTRRQAVYDGLK